MLAHKMSRREFLRLGGMSLTAAALAACVPPATPQPVATPAVKEEVAPAAKEVTISFMGWGGPEEDEGIRAGIEKFQQENPGIKVTWLHTPENYTEKLLANVAAGTPPDTAFIGSDVFQTFARDGMLLDITDMLKNDPVLGAPDYFIQPQEEQRSTRNGRWYGIGSCWVAPHIYYNADIFEEAGIEPPSNDPDEAWDWDHFLEVARQLTVDINGKHPNESGFDGENVERWGIHWPTWWIPLHAAIQSNEGQWIDLETQLLALDQPAATEALQRIADLMLVHHVMPQSTVFQELGMSNTQMLENRKLAMAVDGSWALAWMHKIQATLGTAVLPKMKRPATDLQAHLHSILAATKEPEASWKWLRFLSSQWYQAQFLRIGLWLPSQTALMTEEGLKSWITPGVHPPGYELIVTEYVPRFGHVLYMPPGWAKADSIITPALDAIWIGEKTAEEALKPAVADANAVLKEEAAKG